MWGGPGVPQPTLIAIEGGNAETVGHTRDGNALVGSFCIDLDRELMAVGVDFALFHAAGDLLQSGLATDGC